MTSYQLGLRGAILLIFLLASCSPARIPEVTSSPRSPTATPPFTFLIPLLSSPSPSLAAPLEEAHQDDASLGFEQLYLVLEIAQPNELFLYEICLLTNHSQQAVWIPNDGRSLPFLPPPSGAEMLSLQTTSKSAPIEETASGLVLPPTEQPYSLLVLFHLSYAPPMTIEQWFPLPPTTITALAPQELQVNGKDMWKEGEHAFGERQFTLYRIASPAPDLPLRLTLGKQPLPRARQTEEALILLGGLSVLGAILSAAGLRALQRQRQRARAQALMDAILDLDEHFEQGDFSLQVYEQQRAALKEQLRKTLSP